MARHDRYYIITTNTVVRAKSQRDAVAYVQKNKHKSDLGEAMTQEFSGTRITSKAAQELARAAK